MDIPSKIELTYELFLRKCLYSKKNKAVKNIKGTSGIANIPVKFIAAKLNIIA